MRSKSSSPAISCWQRTLRAEGIAGAWSTINRGVASTSSCRKRDATLNAKGDRSMSEHDDEPPAEVLRTKRSVTGAERSESMPGEMRAA